MQRLLLRRALCLLLVESVTARRLAVQLAWTMLDDVTEVSKIQETTLYLLQRRLRDSSVGFEDERERLVVSVQQDLTPHDVLMKALYTEHDAQRLLFDLCITPLSF